MEAVCSRKPARLGLGLGLALAAFTLWESTSRMVHADESGVVLEVRVTGLESDAGALALALFDSAAAYEARENALHRQFVPIANREGRWRLTGLTPGDYVVIAYHDENGNGELDMRLFGMPKEKVGVSNNVRGRFGPPSYRRASFGVSGDVTHIEIRMQN